MKKRTWLVGVTLVLALAGGAVVTRDIWNPPGAVAQAPRPNPQARGIPVVTGVAQKKTVPLQIELLGTVTPIASVAIKSRLDTEIVGVHFDDGAMVQKGDLLFTLDGRALEAQIRDLEAVLTSARAQLEQNERDLQRYTELVAKNAATQVQLNNARTQVNVWRATSSSTSAKIENLRVQLSYGTIRAPISGRASMATVKVGNFVRPADASPLATIIQIAPVYVSFALPQNNLPSLRAALAAETATVQAIIPGETRRATGHVTMIENAIDSATGTVTVRATMPNADGLLWPGTLVRVVLTFREEVAVVVPPTAVQQSQTGSFVFVVKDGAATVQPVKVARVMQNETVIESGLNGDETVVTDGQLRLTNGSRVAPRAPTAGQNAPPGS
jgi:multidrug efflux system membrane fusion protein